MGDIPVAKRSPIPREWKFPKRGLAIVVLLLGAFAVGGVILATAWPTGVHVDNGPRWVALTRTADLEVDQPLLVPEYKLYLVKLKTGEIIALSSISTRVTQDGACVVAWRPDMKFGHATGWFRDPCGGVTWDLNGYKAFGPAPRGLDQYEVRLVNKEIQVHLGPSVKPIENAPSEAQPYR